ncbi:PIN-like domain-containing protein [Pseudomonas coleopterorum]|uniref:Peptidase C14 n=1 Tax=Pseudomonas coleopterorum TaxID=1605838 RepID=A0ABR9C697_9PSED|nr:PIN-like domain-containing protein [Pseudomonas coleopterorum]MBD8757778.1 peptidase C14 [Pseudomonas coleopterorum]MBD8772122.1 peptidase C14 [Pseudomonas coleopterorum]
MLLGLNLLKQTKDDFLNDLSAVASAQSTLIFIDTNILAYLFKLHDAARREFFDWAVKAIGEGRLFLPAWCAGEYLARVRENQLHTYTPKSKDDQPRKQLEAMLETASLFVDEAVLAASNFDGSRADYLTGFQEAIDGLKQYTRAFRHQFDPDKIHAEIEEHLGPAVLESPIAQLCDRAAKEGPSRIEHRLPPGFRDDAKPENRLGDLIIWLEILRYSEIRSEDFSHVLVLTNDEKSDWVYAPARRLEVVRGSVRPVPNKDPVLKIIDPRLVSEFKQEVGLEHIAICTLSILVQSLSKTDAATVAQLAAAIQIDLVATDEVAAEVGAAPVEIPSFDPEVVEAGAPVNPGVVQEGSVQPEAIPHVLVAPPAPAADIGEAIATAIQMDGYRDADYQSDGPDDLNTIISSLKSHNWYIQNPAILKLSTILHDEFPATSWFVLGRNIYQAACGNAQKAMEFMGSLDTRMNFFLEPSRKYVLAGIVYEIYFDSHGALRETPKAEMIAKPLALIAKPEYEDVRAFIRSKLDAAGANLFFFPGDHGNCQVIVQSELVDDVTPVDEGEKRVLTSITLDGREILTPAAPGINRWHPRYRVSYRGRDIIDDIAISLSIPRWALTLVLDPQPEGDARFFIPEDRQLNPTVVLDGG